nr:hypothetical protein [Streptomyces scabiei]
MLGVRLTTLDGSGAGNGQSTSTYWCNAKVKAATTQSPVLWDVDTEDWKYRDSAKVAQTVISKARRNSVVLMHHIHPTSGAAVPQILRTLTAEGLPIGIGSYRQPERGERQYEPEDRQVQNDHDSGIVHPQAVDGRADHQRSQTRGRCRAEHRYGQADEYPHSAGGFECADRLPQARREVEVVTDRQ